MFFHFTYQLMKKGTAGRGDLVDSLAILRWEGTAEEEKGIEKATGKVRVEVDPKYYRPTEVVSVGSLSSFAGPFACSMECERVIMIVQVCDVCHFRALQEFLLGDASKADRELGWKPKTTFKVSYGLSIHSQSLIEHSPSANYLPEHSCR